MKAHRLLYHSSLGLRVIKKKNLVDRSALAHQALMDPPPAEGQTVFLNRLDLCHTPPDSGELQYKSRELKKANLVDEGALAEEAGLVSNTQKEFIKSFCKSQFPHKSVNLFHILVIMKDKLTNLWGS